MVEAVGCSCLAPISIELMFWAVETVVYIPAPLTLETHASIPQRDTQTKSICSICDIHRVYVSVTRHVHIGSAGTLGEAEVYEEGGVCLNLCLCVCGSVTFLVCVGV